MKPIWRHPVYFLAFGFGSGAVPKAPGTAGTLAAAGIYLLSPPLSALVYGLMLLLPFVLGVYLCGYTAAELGVHE